MNAVPAFLICALLLVSFFGMEMLSAVRAYVGGEGLWSKGQKQATDRLLRYAWLRDPRDYQKFLYYLEVPLGDRRARLELQKPVYDIAAVSEGFVRGGNHPDDIASMVRLFRSFHRISYMSRAISIWTAADGLIDQLLTVGQALHADVEAGRADAARTKASVLRAEAINDQLTVLENAFSSVLGEAARWMWRALVAGTFTAAVIFLWVGLAVSFRISRQLIEELERGLVELKGVNRELESFSYSVSHDLRAPLRAIDGFSGVLVDDHGGRLDTEGRRLLQVIRKNVAQMSRLIDGLLAFSHLGRRSLVFGEVQMNPLAAEIAEELKASDAQRPVEFRIGPLGKINGDPTMIHQVLFNLMSNAFKFTRGQTPAVIQVSRREVNGEAIFSVEDNGAGFEPEFAHKLFGVFQRLHGQTEFEGTGVGLAIVQRIVQRHGGRVWAEGAPGKGARFYFSLPLTPAAGILPASGPALREPGLPASRT